MKTNMIKILSCLIFLLNTCKKNTASIEGHYKSAIDVDGNVYKTVTIGDQLWMAENLKVTHYRNGDPIPHVAENSEWLNLTSGAYCNYDNNKDNASVYGRLYNWYAVIDTRKIALKGWHIPSDDELKELEVYLGMSSEEVNGYGTRGSNEGGKMKEEGTEYWSEPNAGATNESGFSGLPSGYRNIYGAFFNQSYIGFFWTITEFNIYSAWVHDLHYRHSAIERFCEDKSVGFSVRCIKD